MSRPKILKLVQGVHMGLGHEGLKKLLAREDIDVEALQAQDLIMCLNTRGDKMKVIGCKGLVVGYLRMANGQKIMLQALQYIPQTFGAGSFDYNAACKMALRIRLGAHRGTGPLNTAREMQRAGL